MRRPAPRLADRRNAGTAASLIVIALDPGCYHSTARELEQCESRHAAAVLEEALLTAWACCGPRASTLVVNARHGDVAAAIASQAAAWPADLIVLTHRPRPAITRLILGSAADQVMRKASCPVLGIPARQDDRKHRPT